MKLKYTHWWSLLIMAVMMVLGLACFKIPDPGLFSGPDWEWQILRIGARLMVIGFWGLIASLIWSLGAVAISLIRRQRARS